VSGDIVTEIGKNSGAFDVTPADDVSPFTAANPKNLRCRDVLDHRRVPMNEE